MSAERSITNQEKLLELLPADLRPLAEWGWGDLRSRLAITCAQVGLPPAIAATTAARVARMVVQQIYDDVKLHRATGGRSARAIACALCVLAPAIAAAQDPPLVSTQHRLAWSQDAATLQSAQAHQYFAIVDGTRRTDPMLPILCTGTASPFTCSTPFPALTPGEHGISLVAAELLNGVLVQSTPSEPLRVNMVVISAPRNLRVVPPGGEL